MFRCKRLQKYKLNAKLNFNHLNCEINLRLFWGTDKHQNANTNNVYNLFSINGLNIKSKLINIKSKCGEKWELLEIFT